MKINESGNLLDSLVLDTNFAFSGPLITIGDYYYLNAVSYKYDVSGNFSTTTFILKYDHNLNLVKKSRLDSLFNKELPAFKLISINNSIYTAYSSWPNTGTIKLYKLGLNLIKKDSAVIIGDDLRDMETYENNFVISGSNFPQSSTLSLIQVAELDTTFNTLSLFSIDSLAYISACGQRVILGYTAANLSYLGNKKYMITGSYFVCTPPTSTTQTLFKFKTITSTIKNNNKVQSTIITALPGIDHNFMSRGTSSSKKGNRVFSVAIVTNTPSLNLPDTNSTQMQVQCVDSSGILKWVNYFGGDMYYLPSCIYATADSGAIVCGMRYDTAAPKVKSVAEAFVMKIDKNGNQVFVGIQHNGTINTRYHKLFPNPSQNEIHFDVPLQTDIEIVIFDMLGRVEKRVVAYKNRSALSISELNSGTHTYIIKTANGVYSGKFIKE